MSTEQADLQSLIEKYARRLQKLEETRAVKGLNTPPEVLTEIEDISGRLQKLQTELAGYRSPKRSQHPEAPLVHIHCWGKPPPRFPDEARVALNWQEPGKFETLAAGTRRVPALESLPAQTASRGWVRLEGQCSLSVGFALGQVFRAKERYQLEVAQFVPERGVTEYWASNAATPARVPAPVLAGHTAANHHPVGGNTGNDGVVVVAALYTTSTAEILSNVGRYFGEQDAFGHMLNGNTQFKTVKGVLLLEATAATQGHRSLEGWALAQSSTPQVNAFKHRLNPARLHLFMAAPLSLAVFMGHYWANVRQPVQCYEEVGGDRFYEASGRIAVQ
jgi:hypothetical protein